MKKLLCSLILILTISLHASPNDVSKFLNDIINKKMDEYQNQIDKSNGYFSPSSIKYKKSLIEYLEELKKSDNQLKVKYIRSLYLRTIMNSHRGIDIINNSVTIQKLKESESLLKNFELVLIKNNL